MEDIEKLVAALRYCADDDIAQCIGCSREHIYGGTARCYEELMEEAASALETLRAENERIRSTCYPRDGVEAIIRERDAYKEELAESQRRERAAVEDMTAMAYTIRQRGEHDDECCFACKYEIENVACDNYGGGEWECPGFDTDECFKWRGKDVGEQ